MQTGAGEGNRTLVVSLENFCSTIELHPQCPKQQSAPNNNRPPTQRHKQRLPQRQPNNYPLTSPQKSSCFWWRGKDSNLRRQNRQIYSLIPLTAREPLQTEPAIMPIVVLTVKLNRSPARPARQSPKPAFPLCRPGELPMAETPGTQLPSGGDQWRISGFLIDHPLGRNPQLPRK